MRKKRTRVLSAILACSLLILTACGGGASSNGQDVSAPIQSDSQSTGDEIVYADEVTVWAVSTNQEMYSAFYENFQKEYPDVKINFVYNGVDEEKNALRVAASSNTLPTMWYIYAGSLGSFYPENGLTYDLTEIAESRNWAEKYTPASLNLAKYGDELSGFTARVDTISWIYRTDVFEQHNIKVPSTFEELETALAQLKAGGVIPLAFGGQNGWDIMRLMERLIEYYGGADLHDQLIALESDWNCDAVISAFAKYKEWHDLGYFPEGYLTMNPYDVWTYMYNGNAAMHIGGSLELNQIVTANGDIEPYDTFNVATADGKGSRVSIYGNIVQINANATPEEVNSCLLFLEYCASEEANEAIGDLAKYPLPVKDAYIPENMALVEKIIEQEANGTYLILDQALPQEIVDKLFEMQDSVALGIVTPEQAAQTLSQTVADYKANL